MTENIYDPSFVQDLFNRMSSSYERMNYITSFGFSLRWRRQFIRKISGSESPFEIIDLLAGMGETWHAIQKRFPNSTINALDFSIEMIKKSGNKNRRHFNNKVKLIHADILKHTSVRNNTILSFAHSA